MNEEDKAVVRSTIHRLLTADNNEVFAIDTWATKFKGWGCENLPTEYVRPFSQTPFDGFPTWLEKEVPGQRVVAAATLKGVFMIEDFLADAPRVASEKTGMQLPIEYSKKIAERIVKGRKLGGDNGWRRGLVMAGAATWLEITGKWPKRSKLRADGTDRGYGKPAGYIFERWLIDCWHETGLERITFSGIIYL